MGDLNKRFKNKKELEACFMRAEKAQFRLEAILKSLDNVIISKNLDGIITSWNAGAEKIYGYRAEEMLGQPIEKLVPPNKRDELKGICEHIVRGESINALETVRNRKDGNRINVSLTVSPIVEMGGDIREAIIIAQDITDRKKAEESLEESNARIRAISESSMDAIIMIDENDCITYFNPQAEKMFGYGQEEMLGKGLHHFIGAGGRGRDYQEALPRFRETGQCQVMRKLVDRQASRKDGSRVPVEVCIVAMDINGKRHTVGTLRDITERQQWEEERLRTRKLESIGILAGGIAHDFNNLLQVIRGNISFARKFVSPNDMVFNLLSASDESCARAKELSYRLLTFAKGGVPVKKIVSIPEILKGGVEFARSGSSLKVELKVHDDVPPVAADEGQLNQVIQNLVFNAKEAMPDGGLLRVSARSLVISDGDKDKPALKPGKYVKISFEDQGRGIPREDLPKVFDPYFSTKEMGAEKGRGLGLSICYSIVRKHDGLITVESTIGVGTTIHLYLPALEGRPGEKGAGEKSAADFGKILVVDDEEGVRRLAGMMLKDLGYDFEFAKNGEEAVASYRTAREHGRSFDAVIIDLTVPGEEGGQRIIQRLREIDPDVIGIVSSGYADNTVILDYAKFGFAAALPKPYEIEQLSDVLRTLLTRVRQR